MSIGSFSTVIGTLWTSSLASDPNYESPGNFNIPSDYVATTREQNLLTCVDVIRSYIASITHYDEAKLFHEMVTKMLASMPLGGGGQSGTVIGGGALRTFPGSSAASHAQFLGLHHFAAVQREPGL